MIFEVTCGENWSCGTADLPSVAALRVLQQTDVERESNVRLSGSYEDLIETEARLDAAGLRGSGNMAYTGDANGPWELSLSRKWYQL